MPKAEGFYLAIFADKSGEKSNEFKLRSKFWWVGAWKLNLMGCMSLIRIESNGIFTCWWKVFLDNSTIFNSTLVKHRSNSDQ